MAKILWKILAFYPRLGIKVRVTEHRDISEAMQYINGLIATETPYLALCHSKVIEVREFDMTREEMAELVEKYA